MHIFHRTYVAEVESGEGDHHAVIASGPGGEDNGKSQDRNIKEALVYSLDPIEAGHGESVLRLARLARSGGAPDPRHFKRISIRGPDVFEAAQLFHHGSVESFLRAQQIGPDAFLRIHLPDGDENGNWDDRKHDQPDPPIGL